MRKLLFIDDDADLLLSNSKYFTRAGYAVETAVDAAGALALINSGKPDCVILDVMIPGTNGFGLIKKIREITNAPVIFLSGRTEEQSKITGLMMGGNDYMVKPYSLKELSARIQAHTRAAERHEEAARLSFPPLSLDMNARKAYHNENEIQLSNKEYELLCMLASARGETVSFEDIGQAVWGYYTESYRKTIMVAASRLRKKLGDYPGLESAIETVWSKGYKFVGCRRGSDGR